jgi:hypothetical protein
MKKFMWVALVTLLGAASGLAQDVCVGGSQPSDQERFVRAEIQSRIDESIEATEAKDFAAKRTTLRRT